MLALTDGAAQNLSMMDEVSGVATVGADGDDGDDTAAAAGDAESTPNTA